MKKLLAILLSFALLLVPALALAEEGEPPADITGLWYTEVEGMVVELTLNADGTYAVAIPAQPDAGVSGAWEERDGFLHFDGNELPQVKVLGTDVMKWLDYDAFLRREAPLIYAPADPLSDAPVELFTGYWQARFVGVNGAMLFADTLGSPTEALIDGTNVALIGPLTGETVLETAYENGALTWAEGEVSIALALQADGFLRLTLTTGGEAVTLYLLAVPQGEPVGE